MSPLAKYVVRNYGTRPFITAVVLVAMLAAGVTITGVLGITDGLRRAFTPSGHDNWLIVTSGGSIGPEESQLRKDSLARITALKQVTRFSPEVVVKSLVQRDDGGADPIMLRALEPEGFDMHEMRLIEGRTPQKGANEIIIGETLRRTIPWLGIGGALTVLNEKFTCVGVFHAKGYFAGEIWTTRAAVLADPRRTALSMIFLETASQADATALRTAALADRTLDIQVETEAEASVRLRGAHAHLVEAMMLLSVLILGGAAFAASSFLSLIQQGRIAELSLLRAMGFRRRVISGLVLLETELLALFGGGLGIAVAIVGLHNYSVQSSGHGSFVVFNARLSPAMTCGAVAALLLVGLAGALAPMIRAIRIPVTQGLREE